MRFYAQSESERVMKVQEVILRAMSGRISWLEAAEILRWSPRTLRRWRWRYQQRGYDGLYDRRKGRPSPRRVPMDLAQRVLRLYRERYSGFNVKHFHEQLEGRGIKLSYQWVKSALQGAGLVARMPRAQKHRRMRERRPMAGMLVHCDGSTHGWVPGLKWQPDLIAFLDDATSEVYAAYLVEEEGTMSVMAGLRQLLEERGLPCSLYTDRGSHFFLTPAAGQPVDPTQKTQIGRALEQLGIEHIPSYSPQARGRMERFFGTWQGRLPQELQLAGIQDMEAANEYIRLKFIPWHNRHLTVKARESGDAFVPLGQTDLEGILCVQEERIVGLDNTISYGKRRLQIAPAQWRCSFAKSRVKVCEHLDGRISVRYGPRVLGWYDAAGQPLALQKKAA